MGDQGGGLLRDDAEGTARDVLVTPLDHEDVVARLAQPVFDRVLKATEVDDRQVLAGYRGTRDTHHQHVVTCITKYNTNEFCFEFWYLAIDRDRWKFAMCLC